MSARLDAALGYAATGRSVIPVDPGGKLPAIEWKRYQAERATEDRIRHWWTREDWNVGIVCGAISGLVVLDVDAHHGGDHTLAELIATHGLPLTSEATTPSGGSHLWFTHPRRPVGNSAGKLGPGLDIRADGGFVLVPPSTRPEGAYAWCEWLIEPQPLPAWLLDLLVEPTPTPTPRRPLPFDQRPTGPRYITRALEGERSHLLAIPRGEGRRHNELVKAATRIGTLLHLVDHHQAEAIRDELIRTGQDMGLPDKEVRDVVDDQFEFGREHPRSPR